MTLNINFTSLRRLPVVAGLLLAANAFGSSVVIDTFDCNNLVQVTVNGSASANQGISCGASLGGFRNDRLDVASSQGLTDSIYSNPPTGIVSGSVSASDQATAFLMWDGDANGTNNFGLAVDLTGGGTNDQLLFLTQSDLGGTLVVTFWTSGTQYSTITVTLPANGFSGTAAVVVPFSAFIAVGGGTAPSSVSAVTLSVTGPQGMDWTLDSIVANSSTPEPASLTLFGAGLIVLGRLARRK